MAGTASNETLLANTIVDLGLAEKQEVQAIVELRQQMIESGNEPASLANMLVENQVVTTNQAKRAIRKLKEQQTDEQIPGFEIIDKLGAGAMATVYRARQISLDRIVAVKVLPKRFMSDPEFVERFYEEGKAAGKLNHPNIVQAIDVGKHGEHHYFVMEYVEGYSVHDYMEKHGRYSEEEGLQVIIQTAKALKHASERGLIHRDVKPKNIMITNSGIAKLADMGLARAVSDTEAAEAEAGRAYGTPYYISPEQIRGAVDVDFRCDIYGLGATFYHMVTGKLPFEGPNPSAVMHKHLKEPLTPPDHINPELSQGVSEVIEVMMAKNRDDRYGNCDDLLEDLEAVLNGEPPLQARKRFDLAQLAALEEESTDAADTLRKTKKQAITDHPLFFVAAGEAVVIVLLVVLLIVFAIN